MNIEKLTNGIILIGIGILFLLINLGVIHFHWSIFHVLLQLWPLILIVVGINLILKNRYIVVIITWLLFFAAIITYGFVSQKNNVESLGWQKNGDYYYSPNYQEAASKLHFDVSMGVGKFGIDLY